MKAERNVKIRKTAVWLLLLFLIPAVLAGCGKETVSEPEIPEISMYVGLGNTGNDYYEQLHGLILENTGIDVQFVFSRTQDTSNGIISMLEHGDPPADIIVTAAASPAGLQKAAFLDLASFTNIPDLFEATKIREYSVDGGVYQIPFTTRLIGVEYNKTLLEEMGWELPENFEDMKALKEKADAEGIPFAVSGGTATGHGFNYLFYLMGTQYLSSASGTEWLTDFQNGDTGVEAFEEQAAYFQKYAEAGLFGHIHTEDWNAKQEYVEKRALFYYNITNDLGSQGLAGSDGNPASDEYASMPWISENGASNCFTAYDNSFLALDKKLQEPENSAKLQAACTVLQFMTTKPAADLFCSIQEDGFLSVNSFAIDETRLYRNCALQISKGYLQPWYYNSFDAESIVSTGQLVNDYLAGLENGKPEDPEEDFRESPEMKAIMEMLETKNRDRLNGTVKAAAVFGEDLSYEDSARVLAAAFGLSAQKALENAGIDGEIEVSLFPFTRSLKDLPLYRSVPVMQARFYRGDFPEVMMKSVIPAGCTDCVILAIDGEELKRIAESGLTVETGDTADGQTYHYSYACVQKDNSGKKLKLKANQTYLVSVPQMALNPEIRQILTDGGCVVSLNGEPVRGKAEEGMKLYFEQHPQVSAGEIGM